MIQFEQRNQQTLARAVEIEGTGFLTGASIRLRFNPAPPNTGLVFVRTDLQPAVYIPATVEQVSGTQRRTILGQGAGRVEMVEHVLAALAGLHIDNCLIELNAVEPPGLDGSARQFTRCLFRAGIRLQPAFRRIATVTRKTIVEGEGACLALHPASQRELKVSYLLDYGPFAAIPPQRHTLVVTPQTFCQELCDSRTFLLEEEADMLRRQGLGSRTRPSDLLVFGQRGPIDNKLRSGNEPARHKILDIIGDFALLGCDLRGHIVAYRSGHTLNIKLVRLLAAFLNDENHSQCAA
ncbi:MAG: UDP-3-O-acyl-N-acetylglucosamine deacetylase [Gemmatales bacterium]|nr:MAG: UDP-3-O-acyl-N-acetylglucosamine deacetylase [Gemmatales bacterium]